MGGILEPVKIFISNIAVINTYIRSYAMHGPPVANKYVENSYFLHLRPVPFSSC
jgi:hypothetical protein